MELTFSSKAWEEYLHWPKADPGVAERINLLLKAMIRAPFEGIGKPEPLKHALRGWWSRRIDGQHRIVYKVEGEQLWIAQLRYHY